jgi:hypothetical protein
MTLSDTILSTRRNHALEHGAVTVLLERHGFGRSLAGRSNAHGFYIHGSVETEELRSAVNEALTRLQGGEATLAVSPFCGTTIAVTGILAGVATLALAGGASKDRWSKLPTVLLGGMVAVIAGQPLGRVAQKYVTTSPDVARLRVDSISKKGWGPFRAHWVATSWG